MIEAILLYLAELPNWLISGLVGALFGAMGGLLGALLQKLVRAPNLPIILAAVAAVLSLQFTKWVFVPAIVTASLNADLPKKMDEVTTLLRAEFDGRRFAYQYELADIFPAMTAQELKAGLLASLCEHWKVVFASSDTVGADYNYMLRGELLSFVIEPTDCP